MATKRIHELNLYTGAIPADVWRIALDHPDLDEAVYATFADFATNTIEKEISKANHGYTVGQPITHDGTSYILAEATDLSLATVVGLVTQVIDVNTFKIVTSGFVGGLSSRVPGTVYYLSQTAGGVVTTPEVINKPVYLAISSSEVFILQSAPIDTSPIDDFTLNSGTINVLGENSVSSSYTIPSSRFFGVSVEVVGLGAGEEITVQLSEDSTHTQPSYIGTFSDTNNVDNGMGWRYRDTTNNNLLYVKIDKGTPGDINITLKVRGEPF